MALTTNFNQDPYYDDFDDDKNFYRVLFKPGNAVQARELTQLQTILQDQIKKFGDHMFKTGSIVTGGQIVIQNVAYINIASTFSGQDISHINFDKQNILNSANTKRAYVLKSYGADSTAGEPITFIINQLYGDPFTENETIYTQNTDPSSITYYANTASANATGNCQSFSVNEGVFYYDGFFVKTQPQTVAVDKYSRQGNSIIGFTVSEDLIDYTENTTLLDPAQGSSNFQAPGADRYKITMTLDNRALDSTDLTKFVELGVMEGGVPQKVVQTPIYAAIADELARRTADESGDYVIKNFAITLTDSTANSAFINVSLGTGKAYIKGYEFQTIAPTVFSIPKPRTTESVNNHRIASGYGYYVFANGMYGNFATNQYSNVELSLLNTGQIFNYLRPVAGGSVNYSNTVIGNAKVKLVVFDSLDSKANSNGESNNYIYKVYVTDINTNSIAANGGYGLNATGGSTTTIVFPTGFAANNDVYKGLSIRMVGGTPSGQLNDNTARIITEYTGSTLTATVDRPFSTAVGTDHRFILDTKFQSVESLVVRSSTSGGTLLAAANISPLSKNEEVGKPPTSIVASGGIFQPVSVRESKSEPLLIKIGEPNISDNSISDFSYSYRRLYQTVTFTAGTSQTLSLGTGESLQSVGSNLADLKRKYYQIIVTDSGSSWYQVGRTVPAENFTVDTASRTISVIDGANMTANIYAVVSASNPTSKTKRYIRANTTLVDPSSPTPPISVFSNTSAYIAPNDGQTIIAEAFVQRRAGSPQYLFVTDVSSINAIFDFNGTTINTTNYNALDKSAGSSANVTSRYTLNTGQKDSYYEWSAIVLKPGQVAPRGPLLVRYNRFTSNGSGYFDVDSYTRLGSQENGGSGVDYGQIPLFTTQDGFVVALKDYLDFRPVRRDATQLAFASNFVLNVDEAVLGPKIAEPGLDIITDYSYYLPRIDRVVLNKNRNFQILQGTPSVSPVSPVEPDDCMSLYMLSYPPYLSFSSSAAIQTFNNRRYTMKDIGSLDKRIRNLEIYTSLSIAELATINKNDRTIRDSRGLSRPKNGIFVDSFVDKNGADITATDFNAAIDIIGRTCRGSYNIASTKVFSNNSTANFNVETNGPLLMLSSTRVPFVVQNRASKTMNINPFNIVNYIGSIKLDPPSDVWQSTTRLEAQNIDLSGGEAARDAWSSIQSTTWGAWNTQWTSTSQDLGTTTTKTAKVTSGYQSQADAYLKNGGKAVGGGAAASKADITTTVTTKTLETQTLNASRTGVLEQIVPQELTQSFGDRLIDLSIVSYMRDVNVLIIGQRFKPFTTLNAFFDNVNVNDKIAKINRFEMFENDLQYQTELSNSETVTFIRATSNDSIQITDTVIGTGGVVLTSNNSAFITNMAPLASFGSWDQCATNGIWIIGNETGQTYRAVKWYHSTGRVAAATVSSVTLALSAGGAVETSDYVGQKIYIVNGVGKGQSATISAYDSSTRIATIDGTWSITPNTTSVYTIGLLETTEGGACAGIFLIPGDTFRTGEKILRLIDDEFNNIENSRTNGDASFYAQGVVDTRQETSVTVFTPTVQRSTVNETFAASTSSIKSTSQTSVQRNVVVGYYDPLAQTFLINPNQYAQGIIIDSIRVCFKTKDATEPVTCQIRPVQNGYPSASTIYPFGEKTLTPDKVKVTTIPDLNDPNKYTEFKFDVPILLLPGEHSFVLVSNSNGYECFIAEIGGTDLRTSVKISEQPYTGSLFLSQNGSTWSAEQLSDIMFSIQKRVFNTGVGSAFFEVNMSGYSANTVYDVMQLMSTDAVVANTSVSYDFVSEMQTGGQHALLPIIPNVDYECDDGFGRRILSTVTGNTTFQLRATLRSINPDISPMIDLTRLNLLTIENKINNLPLQNTGFVITNGGSGYTGNATVSFTYPAGTPAAVQGAGAAAVGIVTGGVLTKIELTNPGTGYIASPIITLNASGGVTATAVYNGEDSASGGNSNVRYISKKLQLTPGFEAGDLRVYMDAYRPAGSGILVYYKLLSDSDSANFEDNNWYLMTETSDTANFISQNKFDYAELTFAPGVFGTGVPDQTLSYRSANGEAYTKFSQFAVKVVMYGTDFVNVPKIAQLRVIALPEYS